MSNGKKIDNTAAATKSKTGVTTASSNARAIGERKNSAQAPSSQQILGEVSNSHTIGRSMGVRGSAELKSVNSIGAATSNLS